MQQVKLDQRLCTPSKIVCIGRNYIEHIKELNNIIPNAMVVFNKPNSSIGFTIPKVVDEVLHYEAEICFIIENNQYSGVGIGLDLTKRQLQNELKQQGLPWERAKAFDQSAIFSRFVSLQHHDIEKLNFELLINCVRVQCGHVQQMLYSPHTILDELQTYTTLVDGDIIMTGTPQGVGEIHCGDRFLARLKCADEMLLEIEWWV